MDSLGALALATEEPTSRVLERMPSKRDDFLLSPSMVKMIVIQSSYQIAILLGLFWGGYSLFGLVPLNSADSGWDPTDPKITLRTIIFNTFVWLQVFGQLNSRRLEGQRFLIS
jgi:Ca2+-transporting ATPase